MVRSMHGQGHDCKIHDLISLSLSVLRQGLKFKVLPTQAKYAVQKQHSQL